MISNCLLRYSNSSWIQAIAWHCYCNHSLFIEYTERKPFWFWLTPFLSYLLIICRWDWLFVPRSMCKINMVSYIMVGQSSISQKQVFWQIFAWKLRNSSKIQHCTRSQGLPLNTPNKEIVDQACLIEYAGCDEILKCVGYLILHFPFYCDFQVFYRWSIRSSIFRWPLQ